MTLKMLRLVAAVVGIGFAAAQYTATYDPNNLPPKTEQNQAGTNQCGTGSNQTSLCQNAYVNSLDDFCIWAPQEPNSVIGNVEQIVVAWCTKPGRGTRVFPPGTIRNAHFLITPDYVQITGNGNFTQANIQNGDAGGELDPHGPDGLGNPHGGLVFSSAFSNNGTAIQIHEWTNFQSFDEFCIRACKPGPRAAEFCQHIYDIQGCHWNIPGNYSEGFDSCQGDDVIPMGLYPQPGGGTSTYHQEQGPAPPAHPAAPSSNCKVAQSTDLYPQATTAAPSGASGTTVRGGSTGAGPTSSSPPTGAAGPSVRFDGTGLLGMWMCILIGAIGGLVVLF